MNANIKKTPIFHKLKYDLIQGHIRPLLCQNQNSTLDYGLILMKICMNTNIIKTQFFHKMEKFCDFFTLRSNYNLDLCSYGQLLSYFLKNILYIFG